MGDRLLKALHVSRVFNNENEGSARSSTYSREGVHVCERPGATPQYVDSNLVRKPFLFDRVFQLPELAQFKDNPYAGWLVFPVRISSEPLSCRRDALVEFEATATARFAVSKTYGQDPNNIGMFKFEEELNLLACMRTVDMPKYLDGDIHVHKLAAVDIGRIALLCVEGEIQFSQS